MSVEPRKQKKQMKKNIVGVQGKKDKSLPQIPDSSSIYRIKYLTCQGGGMKGIGFVTAAEELEKQGVLQQLEAVAGSSAGAIFATLIAIGCTASEIRDKMMELDFRELMDKDKTFWESAVPIQKIGEGVEAIAEAVQKATENQKSLGKVLGTAVDYLGKAIGTAGKVARVGASLPGSVETASKLILGQETGLAKGEKLVEFVSEMIAKKTGMPNATFNDLARLAETTEGRFKKLVLTGSNLTPRAGEDRLVYFKADDFEGNEKAPNKYGDLPIREAVRISAGFPGAFKAVPLVDSDGHVNTMVDGGLLENLPDYFNSSIIWPEGWEAGPPKTANPACFALSFETPPSDANEKQKVPKNLKDVAVGCLDSLTDEDPLKKKYGNRLANINTKGVGTLEFDASAERRLDLAESGGEAVRLAFSKIREAERTQRIGLDTLKKLPIEELVRLELAYKLQSHMNEHENAMFLNVNSILEELEKNLNTKKKIDEIRLRQQKLLDQRRQRLGTAPLSEIKSDAEISKYCKEKIEFFNTRLQTLYKQKEELEAVKLANEIRHTEVMGHFKNLDFEIEQNRLLSALEKIQKAIKTNRRNFKVLDPVKFKAKRETLEEIYKDLQSKQEKLKNELKEKYKASHSDKLLKILRALNQKQKEIKITQLEAVKEKNPDKASILKKEVIELKNEKREIFKAAKKEYQPESDIYVFLEELEKDSEEDYNFKFPKTIQEVDTLLRKELDNSIAELKNCNTLIKKFEKRQEMLEKYAENVFGDIEIIYRHKTEKVPDIETQRIDFSRRYTAFLKLKEAIDITIDRSTVPFVSWISKYVDKRPGNVRTVKNWLIRTAAAISFGVWTIGLVALSGVSLLGLGVTLAMRKWGTLKMKAAARNVWDWFSWHDPVRYSIMTEMKGIISSCVDALNNSFGNNLYNVEAIYKPFAQFYQEYGMPSGKYKGQIGMLVDDMKPKVNETPAQYKERQLKLMGHIHVLSFGYRIPNEDLETFKRLENFANGILKISNKEKRVKLLWDQVHEIEERYANKPSEKFSKLEVQRYVASIDLLEKEGEKREMPKNFIDQYRTIIDATRQSPTLLHQLGKTVASGSKMTPRATEVTPQKISVQSSDIKDAVEKETKLEHDSKRGIKNPKDI